jgi:hypothetical protein
MSWHERRALVSAVSTVVILAVYSTVMSPRYPAGDPFAPAVFEFWGGFFLLLIPFTIAAQIIIEIAFTIFSRMATQEGEPSVRDERDSLIDLRSARNALYVFSVGVVLAVGTQAFGLEPAVMFVLLIASGVLSALVSDISQFVYYRRGY